MGHMTVHLRRVHGGEAVATLEPPGANVAAFLPELDDLRYPLLRLIDPYDDTEFSSNQMIGLLPELRRLHEETRAPILEQVIKLAERSRVDGTYLAFIGD
jgi:hypothetical protein